MSLVWFILPPIGGPASSSRQGDPVTTTGTGSADPRCNDLLWSAYSAAVAAGWIEI